MIFVGLPFGQGEAWDKKKKDPRGAESEIERLHAQPEKPKGCVHPTWVLEHAPATMHVAGQRCLNIKISGACGGRRRG